MSSPDNPFDDIELPEEKPIANRFGMGRVRLALTRWWMILLFAILGYLVALYILAIVPPSHKATAVLEIATTEQKLVGAELELEKLALQEKLATMANKMLAPSQLRAVASSPEVRALERAVPPETSWKPRFWRDADEGRAMPATSVSESEMVGMIGKWVEVVPRTGTTLMDVSITHPDQDSAIVLANAIVNEYLVKERERKTGGTTDAFKILRDQAQTAANEMEAAEQSLQVYKTALSVSNEINDKRAEITTLRQRYLPKHPKMIQANSLMEQLQKRFSTEMDAVFRAPEESAYWAERKPALDALKEDESDSSETANNAWVSQAQNYLTARASFLQTRVNNAKELYQKITTRITEIDVSEERDEEDIRLAEPAYPSGSVESERFATLAKGLAIGALAGFGIAYILGVIDYRIYDVRSVEEASGLNCLAAIPDSEFFIQEEDEPWKPVIEHETSGPHSEAIRNLRAAIMLLGKKERNKVILITSPAPSEGKTTVALELASAFAMAKEKTLIVDLDLRKPRLHQVLTEFKDMTGTVDVLSGQAELKESIRKTSVEGLFAITSGSKAPSPSELLQEDEIEKLIETLTPHFDRIIIDTPPVLPVSDTRLLAKSVQRVILVVRALKTPVGAVLRTTKLLQDSGVSVAGCVINALPRKHSGSSYYGYKGYGEYGADSRYDYYSDDED